MAVNMKRFTPLYDSNYDDVYGFVAAGEHSLGAMQDAVNEYEGTPYVRSATDTIQVQYFRWVPMGPYSDEPRSVRLIESNPGRGAFLGTVLWM